MTKRDKESVYGLVPGGLSSRKSLKRHRKDLWPPHTLVISKNGKPSAKIMSSRVAETEIDNSF